MGTTIIRLSIRRTYASAAIIAFIGLALVVCAAAAPQHGGAPPATLRGNRTMVIAHRGGAREATENTIAAFQRALRLGAEGIETDLRLTRDGVVVLYHDDRFGRVEGLPAPQRTRLISDMTYAELSATPLLRVGEGDGDSRVPTLDQALAAIGSGVLNIEIKRGARFDELVNKTIATLKGFPDLDRVVLEPPDLKTAEKLREAFGPRLKLHINPEAAGAVPFEAAVEQVLKLRPHSISVHYKRLSLEIVETAHKAGTEVWVWTVDSPEVAQAMRLLGVDAIKTDRPKMMLDLFNGRSR
ncbi:MAG TPA: glycerophosphodiester phosphodiesterase family protein [Blastocatellia bacterium]|nr:glycerophosphodiester phosphodiesterase family protein [Blastocatellia bacterium]